MAPGARRIVISGFVGAGASVYIPKPQGVTIVCWPKAGGTNPDTVRSLLRRDADVRFADNLHMKVYWAEGRGALVGSANLSTNALGSGQLKELMVALPAKAVPIDRLLRSVKSRPVTPVELKKLDREHRKLARYVGWSSRPPMPTDFCDWFNSPHRSDWKLGWWEVETAFSAASKQKARADYDRQPRVAICGRRSDYAPYDWILSFELTSRRVRKPEWVFADFVVNGSAAKHDRTPFEAVQVSSSRELPLPPFIIDRRFSQTLSTACDRFGIERLKAAKTVIPPQRWLQLLHDAHAES